MFFGPDFITVTKVCIKSLWFCSCGLSEVRQLKRPLFSCQTDEDVDWTDIKRHTLEAIATFFESGDPITTPGAVYNESSEYAACP